MPTLVEMITEGRSASITLTVAESDTAVALGSGDIRVLGTPRVVAVCEEAAVAAVAGSLADGTTTVGSNVNLDHLVATGVGGIVVAKATVASVEGKKITFVLEVTEGETVIASGFHTRVVVNRQRFTASVQS